MKKSLQCLLGLWLLCCGFAALAAEPFVWTATAATGRLTVKVEVAPQCYLYADRTQLSATAGGKTLALAVPAPGTVMHADSVSGENVPIYGAGSHEWVFAAANPADAVVKLEYQGCRDAGKAGGNAVCFLPEDLELRPQAAAGTPVAVNPPPVGAENLSGLPFTVERKLEGYTGTADFLSFLRNAAGQATTAASPWGDAGIWMIVLLTLIGGMGLNLTPCILPMIPINLAILGADGSDWKSGMRRASFYGAGMAAAYGLLGVVVVTTGAKFGALNSSYLFNFIIAAVFIALSLAMFGVFNLDFSSYSAKVDPTKFKWGRTMTAFVLGAVAALLAGACVAPVVIAVIVFSSEIYAKGNTAGLLLPFVLGIGMALPWPFAGAGLAVVPRPGQWMERVKLVFGVLILLAAGYYGYLGWSLLPGSYDSAGEFAKLDRAVAESRATGKPIFIDFWATWCKNCAEMERSTFADAAVKQELRNFVVVKFQAEQLSDARVKKLLGDLKINGLPAFIVAKAP